MYKVGRIICKAELEAYWIIQLPNGKWVSLNKSEIDSGYRQFIKWTLDEYTCYENEEDLRTHFVDLRIEPMAETLTSVEAYDIVKLAAVLEV